MDNERNFSLRWRVAERARGRTSMDSFIFHPARPSFHQSFSADSGINPPFPSCLSIQPQQNPSILSSLLHPDVPPTPLNQTFPDSGTYFTTIFPHSPAQLVEDLSVRSYAPLSTMESLNSLNPQSEPCVYQNPPVLSPVLPNQIKDNKKVGYFNSFEQAKSVLIIYNVVVFPLNLFLVGFLN